MKENDITSFMKQTIQIAKEAINKGELPIGAIIVHNNKILAKAYTQDIIQQRRLVHAEFLVLEQIDRLKPSPKERKEMILFTSLEPCIFCLGAAITFGIGKIFYALESPIDGALKLLDYYFDKDEYVIGYTIPDCQGGVLREESLELFRKYASFDSNTGISRWVKLLLKLLRVDIPKN